MYSSLPLFRHTDRTFFRSLFRLALPVSLQQMLTASFSLVDVVMVGQLGQLELAAVGLVSKFYFVIIHVLSGFAAGAGILTAQLAGQQNLRAVPAVLTLALSAMMILVVPATVLTAGFSAELMALLSSEPTIVALGTAYMQKTVPYHILTALVMLYGVMSRSLHHATLPLVAGLTGIVSNTVLNYVLIFGHFGFPAMGVEGAATATVLSRIVEAVILLGGVFRAKLPLRPVGFAALKKLLGKVERSNYWHTSLPIVMTELCWSFGIFSYTVIYGIISPAALAAMSLLEPIEGIFVQFFVGFGASCTILLANQLGAGNFEKAYGQAHFFMAAIPLAGLVAGLLLLLLRFPLFAAFASLDAEVLALADSVLLVIGLVLCLKMFNMTTMYGILRSGGDTRYILLIDVVSMWVVGVPMAYVGAVILKWPLMAVYLMLLLEEVVKMAWSWHRVSSGKWMKRLVGE